MRVAIVSDTHMPRGPRRLPERCIELMSGADLIVHAGDFMEESVLAEISRLGHVVAVHGNVDSPRLTAELPETTQVDLDGVTLAMIHDSGPAKGRLARMRARFPDADAVVFGHSHMPLHESEEADGRRFQIFNPGSPTERRRAPTHTMGMAEVAAGRIEFELVDLG